MIPNFLKFIFNWRIIALQCCVGFCHTTMSISYKYTHVPSLLNFSPTPYSIHLSRSSQSTGLISLCYTAASHQLAILHVIYIHMFQCYSLNAFHFSQLPTALPCLSVQCQADRKKDVWPMGSSAWGAQSQSGRCRKGVTGGAPEFLHFSLPKKSRLQ